MSDPRRLLDEGSDLEVAVLDSARDDAAPRHLHKRIHAALGLGGAIVGAGIGAGTATTAAAATTTAVKGAGLLASVGVAKWVGIALIGSVAAAGAVGATVYLEHRSGAEARGAATATASPAAAEASPTKGGATANGAVTAGANGPSVAPSATSTLTPTPTPTPSPTTTSTSTPSTGAAIAATPEPATPSPTLVSELAPLDAARSALESGDTALALSQLDRHDRDFPHGQLAPEALALRVDTYAQRHDDTKVAELADAFLARYPRHPEARRIAALAPSARHNP